MVPTDARPRVPRQADAARAWLDSRSRHGGGSAKAPDCGKLGTGHEQTETRDRGAFSAGCAAAPRRTPRRGGAGIPPGARRDADACRDPSHAGRAGIAIRAGQRRARQHRSGNRVATGDRDISCQPRQRAAGAGRQGGGRSGVPRGTAPQAQLRGGGPGAGSRAGRSGQDRRSNRGLSRGAAPQSEPAGPAQQSRACPAPGWPIGGRGDAPAPGTRRTSRRTCRPRAIWPDC